MSNETKSYPVSLRWTHQYGYRSGEWANIIGVAMVEPVKLKERPLEPRLCYTVMYQDGVYDSVPMSDRDNFEIKANRVTPHTMTMSLNIKPKIDFDISIEE